MHMASHRENNGWGAHFRATFALGVPLIGAQLAQLGIHTTDVVILGRLGASHLAAIVLSSSFFFTLFLLGSGFANAVMPMVAQAYGRGDTVSVANAAFTPVERSEVEIPLWKDPENIDLLRELLKYAAIALIAAYLIFKVIRPLLQTMLPPPPPPPAPLEVAKGQHIDTVDEEGGAGESPMSESQLLDMRIEEVRAMAQQDPMAVANIIKEWIGANGS